MSGCAGGSLDSTELVAARRAPTRLRGEERCVWRGTHVLAGLPTGHWHALQASVWYGCVLRGDLNSVRIGAFSNVQDRTVIHAARYCVAGREWAPLAVLEQGCSLYILPFRPARGERERPNSRLRKEVGQQT